MLWAREKSLFAHPQQNLYDWPRVRKKRISDFTKEDVWAIIVLLVVMDPRTVNQLHLLFTASFRATLFVYGKVEK